MANHQSQEVFHRYFSTLFPEDLPASAAPRPLYAAGVRERLGRAVLAKATVGARALPVPVLRAPTRPATANKSARAPPMEHGPSAGVQGDEQQEAERAMDEQRNQE